MSEWANLACFGVAVKVRKVDGLSVVVQVPERAEPRNL